MALRSKGITLAAATSGFSCKIIDFGGFAIKRDDAVDVTNQETEDYREFLPGSFVDNGEVSLTIEFDPNETVPLNEDNETITITWPKGTATTAATWAGTGHFTAYNPSGSLGDKMTADVTIKFSGAITQTASA